jgi:hypothetical protein
MLILSPCSTHVGHFWQNANIVFADFPQVVSGFLGLRGRMTTCLLFGVMHEKVFWTLRETTLAVPERVVSCTVHIAHTVVLPFGAFSESGIDTHQHRAIVKVG